MDLEDDAIFLAEIKKGHRWQWWAGFQFLKEGFIVQVPVLKLRPTRAEIDGYTDNGDLYIWNNSMLKLECKSRNISFTNCSNYPFDTAFVERVNTWKRKGKGKPAAILLISQKTGAILTIPTWTEKFWFIKSANDSVRGYIRDYYMLNSNQLVDWKDFIEIIRGRLPGL